MSRCDHGFELTVVPCPHGCGAPPATATPRGPRTRGRHSGYVDMTGKVVSTRASSFVVLREAPSLNGNVRWHCRHSCGGEVILEGIKLRHSLPRYCDHCRPKRPGTVQRTRT